MKTSHCFCAMLLGLLVYVTTVAAMDQYSPPSMEMQDRDQEFELKDDYSSEEIELLRFKHDYSIDELKNQPMNKLIILSKIILKNNVEFTPRLSECWCIRGCCCPNIPELKELEEKLRRDHRILFNLIDTPDDAAQHKELIAQYIQEIAETNFKIFKVRGLICCASCLCCIATVYDLIKKFFRAPEPHYY